MNEGNFFGWNTLLHQFLFQFVVYIELICLRRGVVAKYDLAAPVVLLVSLHNLLNTAPDLGSLPAGLLLSYQTQVQRRLSAVGTHFKHIVCGLVHLPRTYFF